MVQERPLAHAMSASALAGPSKPPLTRDTDAARMRLEAFRAVKPICVQLMAAAPTPLSVTSPHATLLSSLLRIAQGLNSSAFTSSLINYLLFPLTQVLRSASASTHPAAFPAPFLEAAFRFLGFIVRKWRACPEGMEKGAWEQLWRFALSSATHPRSEGSNRDGAKGSGKGKGKEDVQVQEVHLERLKLLDALLLPDPDLSGSVSGSGVSSRHPTESMRTGWNKPSAPLMPSLFQSISYALSQIAPAPPHRELQLVALRTLRPLVRYLDGQHAVLASVLPGLVSGVAKLIAAQEAGIKGDVCEEALGAVQDVLELTLGDKDLRALGVLKGQVSDLADLAESYADTEGGSADASPPAPNGSTKDPFPPLTSSWLAFTASQLYSAIPSMLGTMAEHPSHLARTSAAALAHVIVERSSAALPDLVVPSTRTLLVLSQDDFDPVRHDARRRLRSVYSGVEGHIDVILGDSMRALPRLITSGQDDKAVRQARLIEAISGIAALQGGRNAIADLLGPAGQVERWNWALLACLEFGRADGWSGGNVATRAAQLGWGASLGGTRLISGEGGAGMADEAGGAEEFPELPLRYVEVATARRVARALTAMGRAGGETSLYAVEFMLGLAGGAADKAVPALWVAERLLVGVVEAQLEGEEGRISRKVRKACKNITRTLVLLDEEGEEDEEGGRDDQDGDAETSDALLPVERTQGTNALSTLLDKPTLKDGHIASESKRLHAAAQRVLLTCRTLSLLSQCARALSSSFRPLLLDSLYMVLSHLASPHSIVRTHAELALNHIAHHTGYPTPRALVLDNVDYVINAVSRRLHPGRLAAHAPLVLVALVRLVGSEIVPLVHDVVDEVFDALDAYHGYAVLCSALLAVLHALVGVMSDDTLAEGISEARRSKMAEMRRVDEAPDPQRDFKRFGEWYEARKRVREEGVQEVLERAPQRAWRGDARRGEEDDFAALDGDADPDADAPGNPPPPEEDEPPLSRALEVCKGMLQKAVLFLPHPSPFLRARVLELIAAAIPVLARANREADLLPAIDKGWAGIMARLDEQEGYVVTAAAEVVASLAEHVGDFMSRRVLDQAWPRFAGLLKAQQGKDGRGALARRTATAATATAGGGAYGLGTESAHTHSHRLHAAILRAARSVADEVPVDDAVVWEMMLLLRPFLDRRAHPELITLARGVYASLGRRDGDALWVVLRGSASGAGEMGDTEVVGEVWGWLADERLDLRESAEILLAELEGL